MQKPGGSRDFAEKKKREGFTTFSSFPFLFSLRNLCFLRASVVNRPIN